MSRWSLRQVQADRDNRGDETTDSVGTSYVESVGHTPWTHGESRLSEPGRLPLQKLQADPPTPVSVRAPSTYRTGGVKEIGPSSLTSRGT